MKVLSIAVLALLGQVSAITLKNSANQAAEQEQALESEALEEGRPDDTILLQTETERRTVPRRNHHSLSQQQQLAAARLRANLGTRKYENIYPPAKEGADWFELDNVDERIHGSNRFEEMDDQSPHDPEVADAPEDMKRVGNDHEELHNAKLSPDGYYNGFFHKDYEGNYAQRRARHHHRRGRDNQMIQIQDHENDDDDIPYSYEADGAHAVPKDGQSDFDLLQTGASLKTSDGDSKDWSAYLQHQANVVYDEQNKINDDMERTYAQEEDEGSYEFVQLKSQQGFDHEHDTEDLPDDPYYDPVALHKTRGSRRREPFFDKTQFLAQQQDEKRQADADEVENIMTEQREEDSSEMEQLSREARERQLIEMRAELSQQEREESADVNTQIRNFVGA